MSGSVASGCVTVNSCGPLHTTGSGQIGFFDALIQPVLVYDASGALNTNAVVTGEDGSTYATVTATPVPEPTTLLLLGPGLAAAARMKRSVSRP